MNKLLELKQKLAARTEEAGAIINKAKTENRDMSPEENTAYEAALTEGESLLSQIQALEKTGNNANRLAALSAAIGTPAAAANPGNGGGGGGNPGNGNQPLRAENEFTRVTVHDRWTDQDNLFGPEAPATETPKQRRDRVMYGLGQQLNAVRLAETAAAGTPSLFKHPEVLKLHELNTRHQKAYPEAYQLEKRAQPAGSSEMIPADGGFLIQPDFSNEILMISHETGLIYTRANKIPISPDTNSIKLPGIDEQSRANGSRWGGVLMYWENEADALIGTKPKFRMIELVMKKLTGLYYATNELLADARALGAVVMRAFGEEVGFRLDDGVIRGTGQGQLLGVLNAPCLVTVPKETGQATQTVVYENIKKMWGRMWPRSRANAIWFVNADVEQQLLGLVQIAGIAGESVVGMPGAFPNRAITLTGYGTDYGTSIMSIYGRPVVVVEQCATVGTPGDIILADYSQYVMADKGDVQAAVSLHVRFLTDEQTFRWIFRVDGQPQWHTSLQPFQGTNNMSPFISLAQR
jgi:hypothetical protein